MIGDHAPGDAALRPATTDDAAAVAALHEDRIAEGFLVTLGPAFLRRLYRRVITSTRSFVIVATGPPAGGVCGFVAVAEDTSAFYREFLGRDGLVASALALPRVMRAPRPVFETLRYGLRGGEAGAPRAEILSTAVAADHGRRGIGVALVRSAVAELERRGVASARVVTAVGNVAARRTYERGGFRSSGGDEVHRGVTQELLVWP